MTTELIVPRLVVRDTSDGSVHRVIHVELRLGLVWALDLGRPTSWPRAIRLAELAAAVAGEDGCSAYELADDKWLPNFENVPKLSKHYEEGKRNWELIRPLVSHDVLEDMLRPRHRRRLIEQRGNETKVSALTIERQLKRYWQRGMTLSALIPDYEGNCGKPGERRNQPGRKKPGPKRKYEDDQGISVTSEIEQFLTRACIRYLGSRVMPLRKAWDWLVGLYFIHEQKDEGGCVIARERQGAPSLGQLRYFLNERFSHHERLVRREGSRTYNLLHRPLLSSADWDAEAPGRRFLIDASIADIYLLSSLSRTLVVGRPTVYLVKDAFTRMIVGFYVGFEHPSSAAAALALINVVTPKKEFCAYYGIDIDEEDWPCQHLGEKLLGDCGEMKSVRQWKDVVEELHVEVENTGSWRGDLKGIVERAFGTVQFEFKPFAPGVVEKDAGKRGSRDYRKDAALTLREFTAELILCILTHNSQVLEDRTAPAEMIAAGMAITPINLWRWGSKNRPGALKKLSVDKVALCTLPKEAGSITRRGLEFKNRRYHFPHAIEHEWFSGDNRDQGKITVAYDPRNFDKVYVIDARIPGGYQVASELERVESRSGASLVELNQLDTLNKINNASEEKTAQMRRIDNVSRIEEINSNAKAARKVALAEAEMSAPDVKQMRETRMAELAASFAEKPIPNGGGPQDSKPSELQLAMKRLFEGGANQGGDA